MKTQKTTLRLHSPLAALVLTGSLLVACGAEDIEDAASAEDAGSTESDESGEDCTPIHEGVSTFTEGTLTVGVPENMPYSALDGDDATGKELEIIKLIAEEQCWDLDYVSITYANGIPMITEQQETDLITGGWYVTEERAEQVGFTSPTFFDRVAVVSEDGISTVDELIDAGAVGSMTGAAYQEELSELLGGDLQAYPGPQEIRQDLENGRIQAGMEGFGVATDFYADTDFAIEILESDDRVTTTVEPPLMAFPIDPDNEELSNAVSDFIDTWREDGTLTGILEDYGMEDDLLVPADLAAESIR